MGKGPGFAESMPGLFLLAGLGNPGSRYAETRHNAGFWFVDDLCQRHGIALKSHSRCHGALARAEVHGRQCLLLKPQLFVNRSGLPVRAALEYYGVGPSDLLVVYDELDLPPGTARLKLGGGHGGHNGLRDILQHVPDGDFLRLRIGIGHPGFRAGVTDYVLSRPGPGEESAIRASIARAIEVLPDVLAGELPRAMKALHTQSEDAD